MKYQINVSDVHHKINISMTKVLPGVAPGTALENIVSGSLVAFVAFSLLLRFMPPLTLSILALVFTNTEEEDLT